MANSWHQRSYSVHSRQLLIYRTQRTTATWLLKTDDNGNVEWVKTYSIYGFDTLTSLSTTSDGGYVLSGRTSEDGSSPFNALIVKINSKRQCSLSKKYEIYPNFIRVEEENGSHPEEYSQSFSVTTQTQNGGWSSPGRLSPGEF